MVAADVASRPPGAVRPRGMPQLVTGTLIAAAAAAAAWLVTGWRAFDSIAGLWQPLAFAGCLALAETSDVRLPAREHRCMVGLSGLVVAAGLFWLPPAPFVLATAAGVAAGEALTLARPAGRAFAVARDTLAAAAAALLARAVMSPVAGQGAPRLTLGAPPPEATARWALAVLLASAAFFVVSHFLLTLALSLLRRRTLLATCARVTPFTAALWGANTAEGVAAAVLVRRGPLLLLPLLAVPAAIGALANRAWAGGIVQRERLRALDAAGRAFGAHPTERAGWASFAEHARAALGCDTAAVFLGRPRESALDVVVSGGGRERLAAGGPGRWEAAAERWLERAGWTGVLLVPLVDAGRLAGLLAAAGPGLPGRLTGFDRRAVSALATQAVGALRTQGLLSETERERAALRDIVEHSSDGIYTVGPDRAVRSWNPAMATITGWQAQEAVGRPCHELLRARDGDGADLCARDCPILRAAGTGQEVTREAEIRTRDGDHRWVSYAHAPILTADGAMDADVVVVRDVTRERRAEEAKTAFVANVSHELRSPLTPIKGFLLTLLREDRRLADERRRDYYRLMLGQAERLEALVEDLLEVTRMEAGVGLPAGSPVDAAELVGAVVERFAAAYPGRDLRAVVPPGPVAARGDRPRIEQVLGHLLSNALRYAPAAGPIEAGLTVQDGEVVFHVRDAGPGIPEDEQQRIFERFHRGGSYLTRQPGGAGLGLYLSKRLVEAMGGRIWVDSRLGRGATFSFALPAVAASAAGAGG